VRFEGSTEFVADRDEVFAFLVDPSRMGPCSPAPITRVDDTHFKAQMKVGGGLFAAKVVLELELGEVVDGERATLLARGRGSGTTLTGSTSFTLGRGAAEGVTTVDWTADFELQGMLAGAAGRVIADQGERAIERLLECVRRQLEGQGG
jgi:carbon monoxide dehydrogenase subunit G